MKALVITLKVIVADDRDAHEVRRTVSTIAREDVRMAQLGATTISSMLQCERKASPGEVRRAGFEGA